MKIRSGNALPETEELPALDSLLSPFDRDALAAILLYLVRRKPELEDDIRLGVASLKPQFAAREDADSPQASTFTAQDLAVVRRQMRSVLDEAASQEQYDSWGDDGYGSLLELEEGVKSLVETAGAYTVTNDPYPALQILEAITEELINGWHQVADVVGEAGDVFHHLGRAWAEAILTQELAPKDQKNWISRLKKWQNDGLDSGAYDGLAVAVEAAQQGWDYPPLVRVLQGSLPERGLWDNRRPECATELAIARLNVLERQGRLPEAAYLAKVEHQDDRYAALLVRLERVKEAVDFGMEALLTADSALALAKTLLEHGEIAPALRVAEHGLGLAHPRHNLGIWLRDTALRLGETERALRAAKAAIEERPNLDDYIQLRKFAGESWARARDEILASLRSPEGRLAAGGVEIFLHEGLMQDALNSVRDSWDYDLIAHVVEAATPVLPLQVIPLCIGQAATIMDAGKANIYHHAVKWVERARDAYRAAKQEENWQEFKAALLETHHRKYKLIPMLRDL